MPNHCKLKFMSFKKTTKKWRNFQAWISSNFVLRIGFQSASVPFDCLKWTLIPITLGPRFCWTIKVNCSSVNMCKSGCRDSSLIICIYILTLFQQNMFIYEQKTPRRTNSSVINNPHGRRLSTSIHFFWLCNSLQSSNIHKS